MIFPLLAVFLLVFPNALSANENFTTDVHVEYKIAENGKTLVTNTITIRNNNADFFAQTFILNLSGVSPINIKAAERGEPIPVSVDFMENLYRLRVNFEESLAGVGKTRTFVLSFEEETLVTRTGEVWEVIVPKMVNPDSFRQYRLTLSIPKSFGQEAYISPEPRRVQEDENTTQYRFLKKDLEKSGVTAVFGEFQVYDFELNYHLENPMASESAIEIAIPPDTATQRVFYESLDPKPVRIRVDVDGNWLAEYKLKSKEGKHVKVLGSVQIFAEPIAHLVPTPTNLLANTKPTKYWQTDDPEIKALAQELRSPQEIYDFVTTSLFYNYNRVKPDVERLGAKAALTNPANAICMEFTDLFIALARSAGIPAREVNGYAHSQNPKIQPLSLVADVLHAWPEYWNETEGVWVPVDPTWESTSGVDFFNKLDLKHFVFVIHGQDPEKPYSAGSYKLGDEPQKDVFVTFGEVPENSKSEVRLSYSFLPSLNPFKKVLEVEVINEGPAAVYAITPEIIIDSESYLLGEHISVLPPFGSQKLKTSINLGFLATDAPYRVVVRAHRTQKEVPLNTTQVIIIHLLAFSTILTLILVGVRVRVWKLVPKGKIKKVLSTLGYEFKKKAKKLNQRKRI